MPQYEYLGPGNHYLDGGDTVLAPGDEVELDESTVAHHESRFVEVDEEGVEAPFDPGEFTNDELAEELEDRDLTDAELEALYEAEVEGDNREGAKGAIEDA